MHQYLGAGGGVVVHLAHLDLPLLHCLQNGVDEARGGFAERNLAYGEGLVVYLVDFCSHLDLASACSIVVARRVHEAAGLEIGKKAESLPFEIFYGCITYLVEVVGQDFRIQTHGDALHSLREEKRELHGQRHRFLFPAVVARLPFGDFWARKGFQGQIR